MAGGRKSKAATAAAPTRTLVVDNGAYTIKAGFAEEGSDAASASTPSPRVIPNCLARDRQRRTYMGSELAQCRDFGEMAFRRPVERGYVVGWEVQRAIWEHEFFADAPSSLRCDPAETRLVLTEQPNALPALQANGDQIVFEEFRFASYYRGTAAQFNAYLALDLDLGLNGASSSTLPAEIRLVIDSGYSFSTVTPVLHGRPLQSAVRRLDVGGKLLTSYLTKLLSMRHYDMRHDTYIVNEIKEKACYVALDFAADLDRCWKGTRGGHGSTDTGDNADNGDADRRRRLAQYRAGSAGIAKEYVLPDYHARMEGIVREYGATAATAATAATTIATASATTTATASATDPQPDVLTLRNERFVVPELLFHPADVGLRQPGLADVVAQSVACLPTGLWPALLANVVVVGGNAELPGFVQRLQQEIQARMPDDLLVRLTRPADPITCTWRSAARFAGPANAAAVGRLAVTRQDYDEHGAAWVARQFAGAEADVEGTR